MTKRKKSMNRQPPPSRGWGWLLLGIVAGLFLAGTLYFFRFEVGTAKEAFIKAKSTMAPVKAAPKAAPKKVPAATSAARGPHFDFYNILSEDARKTAPPSYSPAPARHETAKITAPAIKKQFNLQVAALSSLQDADQLKAQLVLSGYTVAIKPYHQDGHKKYRVIVGPYATDSAAQKAQRTLKVQHIDSFLVSINDASRK